MSVLLTGLVGGLLGSAHCIGMCGGFAIALGTSDLPLWPIARRQLIYSCGRVCTYSFLGAVAGYCGLRLGALENGLLTAQQALAMVAGVLMLGIGLGALGVLRWPWRSDLGMGRVLAPLFKQALSTRGWAGFFACGILNGFLPCGLVYAFVALAVSEADMWRGLALMAAFGIGTGPALIALGCGARAMGVAARHHILRVAACTVVVLGGVTIYRAVPVAAEPCCAGHAPVPVATGHALTILGREQDDDDNR